VLRLIVALVLISGAQPALFAGVPSAFAGAVGVHTTGAAPSRAIHPASRFAAPLTPRQRAAAQRLAVAAPNRHRTVDEFVRTGSWIYEPPIDVKTADGAAVRIHLVHGP
jgi:hypothetical protein